MRAVVDIGSNSIKFLLKDPEDLPRGHGLPVMKSWTTGLGRGINALGVLSSLSIENSKQALLEMVKIFEKIGEPIEIIAVATSAVRDAKNPEAIINLVAEILKTRLIVLSGAEEALWSHKGASEAAKIVCPNQQCLFVDIGGASSEISYNDSQGTYHAHSFQAGAVRCHEGLYLGENAVSDEKWAKAQVDIKKFFPDSEWIPLMQSAPAFHCLVAVSGSLVAAAKAFGAQNHEGIAQSLSLKRLQEMNEKLRLLHPKDRVSQFHFDSGRADVLCAGILCVTHIMKRSQIENLFVTSWGLRHGIMGNWDKFVKNHLTM